MNNLSIIGGEFAINLENANNKDKIKENGFFYSSGRSALFNILMYLQQNFKYRRILLPDYLCETIPEACVKADYIIDFYSLNEDLSIDYKNFTSLYDCHSVALIINYFGLINCKEVVERLQSINPNMLIIQDNVQAYFEMNNDTDADFYFTSFRKSLPIVDGSWVRTRFDGLPIYNVSNKFSQYKFAGNHLKIYKNLNCIGDDICLELLDKGEEMISSEYCTNMNVVTPSLYNILDIKQISAIRIRNAEILLKGLKDINIAPIVPLESGHTPLFLPIRVKDRNKIRKVMSGQNIFCPVHWPINEYKNLNRGLELSQSELSLIVDQRYSENDMLRILNILEKFEKK